MESDKPQNNRHSYTGRNGERSRPPRSHPQSNLASSVIRCDSHGAHVPLPKYGPEQIVSDVLRFAPLLWERHSTQVFDQRLQAQQACRIELYTPTCTGAGRRRTTVIYGPAREASRHLCGLHDKRHQRFYHKMQDSVTLLEGEKWT